MHIKYEPFCALSLQHNYYENSLMRDFSIMVPWNTKHLMDRHKIHFRQTAEGMLLYRKVTSDKSLDELASAPIKMYFSLGSADPYFLAFSQLPQKRETTDHITLDGEKRYVFSNLTTSVFNEKVFLHPGEFVESTDRLKIVSARLQLRVDEPVAESSHVLSIRDQSGARVSEVNITIPKGVSEEHPFPLRLDLSEDLQHGNRYTLFWNDEEIETVLVLDQPEEFKGLGVIEIGFGGFDEQLIFLETTDTAEGEKLSIKKEDYSILFDNRKTKLRYNLIHKEQKEFTYRIMKINKEEKGITGAEVVSNISSLSGDEVTFVEKTAEKPLPSGDEPRLLLLEEETPMEENPNIFFVLEVHEEGTDPINIILPHAGKSGVKLIDPDSATESYLSDIYVYF
jgi:hypothetical protein